MKRSCEKLLKNVRGGYGNYSSRKLITALRHGFTIMELVIVIAVIAVLAAVLIPTFANVTRRANQTADEQAVYQMNLALAVVEIDDRPENVADVIAVLNTEGMDLEDYSPLLSDTRFYWVKSINRIVIADGDDNVLYPEDRVELVRTAGDWYSLDGNINLNESWKENVSQNTVTLTSGEQFASFISEYNNGDSVAASVTTVNLSGTIDLGGATYSIKNQINSDLTIQGTSSSQPALITGFRDDNNSIFGQGEFAHKGYGYGIFSNIGANSKITLKNLVFENMLVKDTLEDTGTMGLIAGYVYGTLNLENVTIRNSIVEGGQKIGGIAGRVNGTLNMNGVTVENVSVGGYVEVAQLVGYLNKDTSNITAQDVTVTSVNVYSTYDLAPLVNGTAIDPEVLAETGKLYVSENVMSNCDGTNAYYVWPCLTDDYYWLVSPKFIEIDGKTYYKPETSTSSNITNGQIVE